MLARGGRIDTTQKTYTAQARRKHEASTKQARSAAQAPQCVAARTLTKSNT